MITITFFFKNPSYIYFNRNGATNYKNLMVEYRQNLNGYKQSIIYRKPLSVGQVAKICRVSKKTVLNWIYRKAISAFTTLGGHYRIWPVDLKNFLVKSGMDIPFHYVDHRQTSFLIIDDDISYSALLKEVILREFPNADVLITDDGYEGLILIGERRPNVVILDLKMPKVDGFEVLKLLKPRKKDHSMYIIVLSAYVDENVRIKLRNTVADRILEKDDDIYKIINTFKDILKPKQQNLPQSVPTFSYSNYHKN